MSQLNHHPKRNNNQKKQPHNSMYSTSSTTTATSSNVSPSPAGTPLQLSSQGGGKVPSYSATLHSLLHPNKEIAAFTADGSKLIAVPFDQVEHNDGFCAALEAQRGKNRGQQPRPWDFLAHVCADALIDTTPTRKQTTFTVNCDSEDAFDEDQEQEAGGAAEIPGHKCCAQGTQCGKLHLTLPERSYRVLPVHVNSQRQTPGGVPSDADRLPPGVHIFVAPPPAGRISETSAASNLGEEPKPYDSSKLMRTAGSVEALALTLAAIGKSFKDLKQVASPNDAAHITEEEFLAGTRSPVKNHQHCSHFIEGICFRGPKCHFLHVCDMKAEPVPPAKGGEAASHFGVRILPPSAPAPQAPNYMWAPQMHMPVQMVPGPSSPMMMWPQPVYFQQPAFQPRVPTGFAPVGAPPQFYAPGYHSYVPYVMQ